ncbi:hypothetical protein HQQ81_03895 [Microbacteriaceae bacterium VKM Ac-2854]|nr:hypothetical protein [Microbacteriaceae bacterium VKM Ac-2854]
MPSRVPLPDDLAGAPFLVRDARLTPARLRGPDLLAPFHGVRTTDHDASLEALARALMPVLSERMLFSHETAARLRGLHLPERADDEPLHVAVRAPARALRRRGVSGHAFTDPRVRGILRRGFPMTDPASTFCHLAQSLSLEDLVAVGDQLLRTPVYQDPRDPRPWVALAALRDRVHTYTGPGAIAARAAVDLVRDGPESRQESRLRLVLLADGLPEPELNVDVFDRRDEHVARLDLYYRTGRVGVEYDGGQHGELAQWAKHARRLDDLAALGVRVVRITGDEFIPRPSASVARVRRALLERGWRP